MHMYTHRHTYIHMIHGTCTHCYRPYLTVLGVSTKTLPIKSTP